MRAFWGGFLSSIGTSGYLLAAAAVAIGSAVMLVPIWHAIAGEEPAQPAESTLAAAQAGNGIAAPDPNSPAGRRKSVKPVMPPVDPAKVNPADNSYCYVCHANYEEEELVVLHQPAGIGCESCHGMSEKHSADEDSLTAPDIMYAPRHVVENCKICHTREELAAAPDHKPLLPNGTIDKQPCTECHGEHELEVRTRRWNEDTGERIADDVIHAMDRKAEASGPNP